MEVKDTYNTFINTIRKINKLDNITNQQKNIIKESQKNRGAENASSSS